MTNYFYIAKSFKGEKISGQHEAKDQKELAKILREEGFILIRADTEKKRFLKGRFYFLFYGLFFGKVSLKEKIIFTRNLRVMISAGVSLPRALSTLSLQSRNKSFTRALLKIRSEIIKGKTFSETIKNHPNIFSNIYYNLVMIGEQSGTLIKSLDGLISQMEKDYKLRTNIRSALVYPSVIVFTMIVIGILMITIVIPRLTETFKEMGIEIPFTTKVLVGLSYFLIEKWYFVILAVLVFIFSAASYFKTKGGKKIIDYVFLRLPILSSLIIKTSSAYIIRTLSTLIDAGLPILQSLDVLCGSVENYYFRKSIITAREKVKSGESLTRSLESFVDLYTPMVLQMMQVGEETGKTTEVLKQTADFLEEEVTRTTENLSTLIEPLIILLIGGAVGFFAVSIIQPIYQMMGAI